MATFALEYRTPPSRMELGRVLLVHPIAFTARAPADDVPPVISGWSPAANATVDRIDVIDVIASDIVALSTVAISARFDALGVEELIYDGVAFTAAYSGSSVVITGTTQAFSLVRDDGGWLDAVTLRVTAVDRSGNRTLGAAAYEVRGAVEAAATARVPVAWTRPTLAQLIDQARSDFRLLPGGEGPLFKRSVESVLARLVPALAHGLHGRQQYIAQNIFPLPGSAEATVRSWAMMVLAQPSRPASPATGIVSYVADAGTSLPLGTPVQRADGEAYKVTAEALEAGGVILASVQADVAGAASNAPDATELRLLTPVAGVASAGDVIAPGLSGGSDTEAVTSIQQRTLDRLKTPPRGGATPDYVTWALELDFVDRAWAFAQELGPGFVTVRFTVAGDDPIPSAAQVAQVQAYIDLRRPSTATPVVVAPIEVLLSPTLSISPDTPAIRAAVVAELRSLLLTSEPNVVLPWTHIGEAISGAAGEFDHRLTSPATDVDPGPGGLLVLGTPTWITWS